MRFCLLIIAFIFSQLVHSETIEVEEAKRIAEVSFGCKYKYFVVEVSDNYIVFSKGRDCGYVIVNTTCDGPLRIIGYSEYGNWDAQKLPPYLRQWIKSHNRYTSYQKVADKKRISQTRSPESRLPVPILLKTSWHQRKPYNKFSPIVEDGNIQSVAGCVAIASSQIVYYWHKDNPSSTFYDTPTYSYGKAPVTYSVPAGTEYRWNLIRNEYIGKESEDEEDAVANLAYIVGTSAWLQFSATGTGGHINEVVRPFSSQFRLSGRYYMKSKFSQEEWELLLYNNLSKQQPILYAGSSSYGGHAVVIDGYDAKLNLFHFNFGWGGEGDGYYTVDDITGMGGYNYDQSCVCDIYPMERNISIEQDIPVLLQNGVNTKFQLRITNNSTLDIKELHYFLIPSDCETSINQKESAVFSSLKEIPNNGKLFDFTVSFTSNVNAGEYYLVLTDENLRNLKQVKVAIIGDTKIQDVNVGGLNKINIHKESGGVLCVETEEETKVEIFSIDGRIVFTDYVDGTIRLHLSHGLYIVNKVKWLQ